MGGLSRKTSQDKLVEELSSKKEMLRQLKGQTLGPLATKGICRRNWMLNYENIA